MENGLTVLIDNVLHGRHDNQRWMPMIAGLGIVCAIFTFYISSMLQNVKITKKITSCEFGRFSQVINPVIWPNTSSSDCAMLQLHLVSELYA